MSKTTMDQVGSNKLEKNFQLSPGDFERLLMELQQGNEKIFEEVFLSQFKPAINYLKKRFKAGHELAYDTVMVTMTDFFYRLKDGKISYGNLRYLFTQMMVQNYYRQHKKEWNYEEFDGIDLLDISENKEEVMTLFDQAFAQLGEGCQNLLKAFYFENESYPDLAEKTGRSQAAIRKQKQRCLNKFKAFFNTLLLQNQ